MLKQGASQNKQVETIASAPSLKAKLTGDTWSHHQVSRSPEQHAEEILCLWYPIWHGFDGMVLRSYIAGGTYASSLPTLLRTRYSQKADRGVPGAHEFPKGAQRDPHV